MLKLEMELSEFDYDTVLETALPRLTEQLRNSGNPLGILLANGVSSGMTKKILSSLSQSQKDKLLADLINSNSGRAKEKLADMAASRGIHVVIHSIKATAK